MRAIVIALLSEGIAFGMDYVIYRYAFGLPQSWAFALAYLTATIVVGLYAIRRDVVRALVRLK